MHSSGYKVPAVAALFSVLIAGPTSVSALPFFQVQISGSVVDANGNGSTFGETSPPPDAVPARLGRTMTDWQVGANALAEHGGTTESDIQMGPPPTVTGAGFASTLLSQSTILYDITLSGNAPDTVVPVHIGASGIAAWSQNGAATAGFEFDGLGLTPLQIREVVDQNAPGKDRLQGSDSFSVDTTVGLIPGNTYSVLLFTSAFSDIREFQSLPDGTIPFGEDTAVVDPTFTVVGDFASRWTIVGVPGAATGGVPEPAIWSMLIVGFGLAGASLRRRGVAAPAT